MQIAARYRPALYLLTSISLLALTAVAPAVGPDVVYSDINGISNTGTVGSITSYSYGSYTCNMGNLNLSWTNGGTPGLAMNLFRLHNGRLEQIGLGFAKVACCAAASPNCGMACNGQGGSVLGAGCRDPYGSLYNAGQNRLAPRSIVNAFTGAFPVGSYSSGNAIFRRLQVPTSDISATNFPGALYFAEGIYVGTDDAQNSNGLNNASYKRVTISGTTMTAQGTMQVGIPAIKAWQDHGNGVNTPDQNVLVNPVDVPGEGRFWLASRATPIAGGYHYEYAVYNLNSHRSARLFQVNVNSNGLTNIGFHDVFYHSGEPYDPVPDNPANMSTYGPVATDDWPAAADAVQGTLEWATSTFAQNANANAIRWGTLYNFRFDSPAPPKARPGRVKIGLFRPGAAGAPDAVFGAAVVPGAVPTAPDLLDIGG